MNIRSGYAMFTPAGNQAVRDIVVATIDFAKRLGMPDDEVWQLAYSRLEMLSRVNGFAEATDTEVRELVWEQLIQSGAIAQPDQVNYWFYIDWLDLDEPDWTDRFSIAAGDPDLV